MSGTSNSSSLSKGSTLSYDAPVFVPSFLRNSAIETPVTPNTPSSTPLTRAATAFTASLLSPLIGQVLRGELSLEQPFDELCYKTYCAQTDPMGVLKSEARYIENRYFRHHGPPESKPGKVRPVINAPVPPWATGEARNLSYVFAMGTFEGHTDDTLPASLKRFAIPVVTLRSNAKIANSPDSIRITPTWNLRDKECCWVIAIPVGLPPSEAPTKKWNGAVKGYSLEPEEMKKLMAISDQRLKEFEEMAQITQSFKDYFKTLCASRLERPEKVTFVSITNMGVVSPSPSTSSSKPSAPTQIVPEVKATCWGSKRGREEDQLPTVPANSTFDCRSQQPLRRSKRLCVSKDSWKEKKAVQYGK